MKFSVPFIPDKPYTGFLKTLQPNLESLYFPLYSGPRLDSRIRFHSMGIQKLAHELQAFEGIKKYCLINSRFIRPEIYHDSLILNDVSDGIRILVRDAGMTGLVFSDVYLIHALSKTSPDVVSHLEAVPSVNCMMDSAEKAFAFLDLILGYGYRIPSKIALDRSLNRNLIMLEKTANEIRQSYPSMKIELLANEGCMAHCPFKLSHDAQIAYSNIGISKENTHYINQTLGCQAYFYESPERFFRSPFIRPEDLPAYQALADSIKLCGRTLGSKFMTDCISAYTQGSYDGNLLLLMDAAHFLSDRIHIDNKKLDPGFLSMLTSCLKDCKSCLFCQNLFQTASRRKPLKIKAYRDYS